MGRVEFRQGVLNLEPEIQGYLTLETWCFCEVCQRDLFMQHKALYRVTIKCKAYSTTPKVHLVRRLTSEIELWDDQKWNYDQCKAQTRRYIDLIHDSTGIF